MVNVLGVGDDLLEETMRPLDRALGIPGAAIHWYGKSHVRAQRKMGHVTLTAASPAELAARLDELAGDTEAMGQEVPATGQGPDPLVGIIMGSDSDLPAMKQAAEVLRDFGIPFELTIVSAHRTPERMVEYARRAHARGLRVIIAGAGGAAHLPGMVAAMTPLPVIGVPIAVGPLGGQDALLSIVQMPRGVPVAAVAVGNAANGGLLAARILAASDPALQRRMVEYQEALETAVVEKATRLEEVGWQRYTQNTS
jgi:phosphoribosylaminoimidazole carboxylase